MNNTDCNVLLVDDHAVVRAGYRHLLETQGGFSQVREAENAQEAFAACQKELPVLIICDISMPEPVGLSLIQRVLGRWPDVKFLMFTMHNSIELARACMDAGAKGYVTKSSRPEVLLRAIGEVLAGRTFISADLSRLMALSRLRDNRAGWVNSAAGSSRCCVCWLRGNRPSKLVSCFFSAQKPFTTFITKSKEIAGQ